jgi:hypothetical protein
MSEIIIGSDFEVFIFDNHNLIECDLLLPNATKSEPILYKRHYITHDRKSLECSIPPFIFDMNDKLQFYKKIIFSINILEEFIKNINPIYRLVFKDYHESEYNYKDDKRIKNDRNEKDLNKSF